DRRRGARPRGVRLRDVPLAHREGHGGADGAPDRDPAPRRRPVLVVVGLVIVSHSAKLAEGVVELARQMGGEDVAIEAAGGMADPPGEIGTDMAVVMEAIERAASPDGVIGLMGLGSAVMSAEMAAEMVSGTEVLLCEAPLVEGAVAAAARARTGADLAEVAAEARAALGMKASQLGAEDAAPAPVTEALTGAEEL